MVRVVGEAHERDGVAMEPGRTVFLSVAGANRDPAVFDGPDRLWLARPNAHHHLGFGYGIHFCVGAPLARQELEVSLAGLIERFPGLTLDAEPEYQPNFVIRGLTGLRLRR
jgi:cytochrome P450